MLHSSQLLSPSHFFKAALQPGLLVFVLMLLVPVQAAAQRESCNPALDFTILTPSPYFLGDTLRISANLGAKDIVGGSYQDIHAFGYALNCHSGENFQTCTSEGNTVEFKGNMSTNCLNSNGQPAQLAFPESNVIPITTVGYPIRTGANEQCNVQFDFSVEELNGIDNMVIQAMGWPVPGEKATVCSNGLTSAASSTIGFRIQDCAIDLKKQVSVDGQNWFDADSADAAPSLLLGGDAYYRLIVTNTGTVGYVQPVSVVDAALGIDTTIPALAKGASVILTGNDIAQLTAEGHCQVLGSLQNTASVQGVCRSGGSPVDAADQDSAFLVCAGTASIDIEKSTNGQDADSPTGPVVPVGGAVTWTYQVTNDGQLPLSSVAVSDSDLGPITCPKTALAVGESMTCTANGTAMAGQYANTGFVIANSASGPVNDSDDSHYFGATGAIDIVKSASPTTYAAAGVGITYTFVVTNTGNVTLSNVTVTDPLPGLGAISCNWAGSSDAGTPAGTLSPGETVNCSASYTTTQADVNAGKVDNLATATGTPPSGPNVQDSDPETITSTATAAIDIVKSASPTTYAAAGVGITYTFVVTNTGNVTLSNVTVTDPLPGLGAISCNWAGSSDAGTPAGTLSPGETVSCSAAYTTTQADVDAGQVDNLATATGTPPSGPNVQDSDPETITSTALPDIDLRKEIWNGTAFVDANSAAAAPVKTWPAGAIYRIIVKNTGTVPLYDVVINDAALGISNYAPVGMGGAGTLAVDEEVIVTSAQVPALEQQSRCTSSGDYENIASTSGKSVATDSQVSDTDPAWLKCVGTPNLTVIKEISIDGGDTWIDGTAGPVEFPSGALYRITVENTGSVKLVNVTVSDTLIGPPDHVIGELEVGETVVVADGVIEVGDSDWSALDVAEVCDGSGLFENIASVTGTSDELASDEVTRTDNAQLECVGRPLIEVKKEVSLDNGANWQDANEEPFPTAVTDPLNPVTALYRITVTNVGGVPLTGVVVNDTNLGIIDYAPTGAGGSGVLAVGESVVIDSGNLPLLTVQNRCATAGEKANVASAEGYSAAGIKDTDTDSATVECVGQPAIRITKEVSSDGVNFEDVSTSAVVPSDAWYRITVENIGTVDLENVTISDATLGLIDVVVTGVGGLGELAVGEIVVLRHVNGGANTVPALYVPGLCVEADVYTNTAVADGKSVDSVQTVNDSDDATLYCAQVLDLCEDGKPAQLKLQYDADADTSHSQTSGASISPQNAVFPAGPVWISVHDHRDKVLVFSGTVSPGGTFWVSGPQKLVSSAYWFRIYTVQGGTLLQTVTFHTSCSQPLNVGDEFGAVTVLGGTH